LRIGCSIQPKRDLSRFVKWPKYVRLQRQRAILKKRLKIPPAIHQFSRTLDKNHAMSLFKLFSHYRPESHYEKKKRLLEVAKAEVKESKSGKKEEAKTSSGAAGASKESKSMKSTEKPYFVKYGLSHVTTLIERKKAKLVCIAHDVDPIELVLWMPALCRKMEVPFCFVKGKARLGQVVHKKTASVLALTEVRKEDHSKFEQLLQYIKTNYSDLTAESKKWGGGIMGIKTQAVIRKRERVAAREAAKHLK